MSSTEQDLADIHRGLASAAGMISGMLVRRRISRDQLAQARQRARAALDVLDLLEVEPPAPRSVPRAKSKRARL